MCMYTYDKFDFLIFLFKTLNVDTRIFTIYVLDKNKKKKKSTVYSSFFYITVRSKGVNFAWTVILGPAVQN